jgi:hypothetical protein
MRTLALVAAALMPFFSGCVSNTCDFPTATLQWQLQDPGGTPWSCYQAGVAWVDVYVGTSQPYRFPCTDGGAVIDLTPFAAGTYPTTVEGVGSDLVTIYNRARPLDLTVTSCGGGQYYPVLGEGLLDIDYHFSPDVCTPGGYMWFALYDEVAGNYISTVNASTPVVSPDYTVWQTYYGCYSTGGGTPLRFPVPFGTYTLAWIQEVVSPLASPAAVQQACVQPSVQVTSAGTTLYPVMLLDNTVTPQFCAAYP